MNNTQVVDDIFGLSTISVDHSVSDDTLNTHSVDEEACQDRVPLSRMWFALFIVCAINLLEITFPGT